MSLPKKIEQCRALLESLTADDSSIVFANSLGAEDMVLTDLIAKYARQINVFTLDTGRLHEQTYSLLDKLHSHYGLEISIYYPNTQPLQEFTRDNGVNAFYRDVDLRKQCCHLRKVEPLKRALKGHDAWITGLRRQQAITRTALSEREWDDVNGLYKINPLADWKHSDVWSYLYENDVPYNDLHDDGYPSIGCEPCTRAISVGEDVRAGRWWWENPVTKECGLHLSSDASKDAVKLKVVKTE